MDGLRQGIFRILCTAVVCSLAGSVANGTGLHRMVRFLSGILLTVSLLSILPGVEFSAIAEEILPQLDAPPAPVAEGEEMSGRAIAQFIIQETEAYILHKAAALGMDIRVDVYLSEGEFPVPEAAVIQGEYSDIQKQELSAMMEAELGITGEDQRWIG